MRQQRAADGKAGGLEGFAGDRLVRRGWKKKRAPIVALATSIPSSRERNIYRADRSPVLSVTFICYQRLLTYALVSGTTLRGRFFDDFDDRGLVHGSE